MTNVVYSCTNYGRHSYLPIFLSSYIQLYSVHCMTYTSPPGLPSFPFPLRTALMVIFFPCRSTTVPTTTRTLPTGIGFRSLQLTWVGGDESGGWDDGMMAAEVEVTSGSGSGSGCEWQRLWQRLW